MAIFNADTVATQSGKSKANAADNTTDRQVTAQRVSGRRRTYSSRFESAGEAIASVLRLAWLPLGATIKGGRLAFEAQGSSFTCKLGIAGAGGTLDDNDDIFLAAATDLSAAGALDFPTAALAAVGTARDNKPGNYTITDPDGAYIILTTAGAVTGTAKDIDIDVDYVLD